MPGYLILGAVVAETRPCRELLEGKDTANRKLHFGECGVGMAAAAASTANLINKYSPDEVIFIGSSGAIDLEPPILTFITPIDVVLADASFADGGAFICEPYVTAYSSTGKSRALFLRCQTHPILEARIYCPLSITRNRILGRTLSDYSSAAFENLELFGVAAACTASDIPWSALSCITNRIEAEGHEQWLSNHQRAAVLTAEFLASALNAVA